MKVKFLINFVFVLSVLMSTNVLAQGAEGVESFKQDRNSWRRQKQEKTEEKKDITQKMRDTIPVNAMRNITEAEQAFCYTVTAPDADYKGYLIDSMAVTGFCGMLSQAEIQLFIDEFLKKEESVSNVVAQCIIQPRLMLRFIRGVDYTDVLFSSPCYAFSVFYAGSINTFNISPASAVENAIIEAYEKRKMTFVSPALLGQILPIGVPQNSEQRELVLEKAQQAPVRNWQVPKQPEENKATQQEPKGWNKLKYN